MAGARVERRLAAILAADVVRYSGLMEADENGTFARLKRLRTDVVEPILAQHGGRIVDLKGDGAMVEFQSAVDAVEAAVAVQRTLISEDADLPETQRLRLRIGINLGDVIVDGGAIYGDGVNVACRIQSLCEPGGVWLSRSIHDQVKGKLEFEFVSTGRHQVKNISEAVETYRIAMEGVVVTKPRRDPSRLRRFAAILAGAAVPILIIGAALHFRSTEQIPTKPAIAVLPFENYGGDEATGRLADGITEDIITDLTRFRDLDVIDRNSTTTYKGKSVDLRQVGKDLKVGYVLEGSVQRQNDRIRLTAQLVDATDGTHIWADRWDRSAADIFSVQSEIAEITATNVGGYSGITLAARAELAKRKHPDNLDAYDLYLLALDAKHRETKEDEEKAIQFLKESLEIDPNSARSWTALAWSYQLLQALTADTPELQQLRLDAAKRAVELDPADAEAHAALATILGTVYGDLARAEAEYDRALEINPGSADILAMYAAWGSSFGKPERGVEAARRAMRLNPNMPPWAIGNYAYAYFMAGDYEEAIRMLNKKSHDTLIRYEYVMRSGALAALGRQTEARSAMAEALAKFPGVSIEGFAILDPVWAPVERERLISTMRAAGFPACASIDAWANAAADLKRLPECLRTTQAQENG